MFLIRSIAKKITSLLSGVRIPRQYQRNDWRVEYPYIQTKTFQILPVSISDNYCLIISQIIISDNLLPVAPEILEKSELLQPVKIYELEEQLSFAIPKIFDKSSLFEIDTANSYNRTELIPEVKTFSYDKISLSSPIIWNNLFKSLREPSIKGKIFNKEIKTKNVNNLQPVARIRKAYSSDKELSPWDLLYPSLCPPLLFDFSEELDSLNRLRGYQKEGVSFLVEHPSALLADEMGTGKTVQTVNAVRILFRLAKISCALIVCPPAVIGSASLSQETGKSEGWDGHFYHWANELLVTVVRGSPEQREIDWKMPAHIYITTYGHLRDDLRDGILKETDLRKFDCVVLDEAQTIKNRNSKISKAVRKFQSKYRWALTGTPIENKIQEVISIFEFVKPGLFKGNDYSLQQVRSLIDEYMRRRLKRHVLKDLPPKIYQELRLELNPDQKAAYENEINVGRLQIEQSIHNQKESIIRTNVLGLIAKLKQICNFAPGKETSPKAELLFDYIETIKENNAKVIVFSQYRKEGLDKLEKLLTRQRVGFVSYIGGMSDKHKNQVVNDFKTNPELNVFLAQIDSAGVGLTLTEASYVVHFDHLWNPAKMQQAEDRAHRMGQTNAVTVYSFWMQDTIEEKIKKKLDDKRLLIENAIDSLAVEPLNELTTQDLLDIIGVKESTKPAKTKDKMSAVSSQSTSQDIEPKIDFAIITAIDPERLAVCQAFQIMDEDRVFKGSRVYWRKRLDDIRNGGFYEIVITQSPDMANVDAALLASDTIHHWHPEAMLMVGIAGAATPEQALGDIVVANTVHYYERAKITPDGSKPEPYQYPVDQTLWSRIIALPEWNANIPMLRPDGAETRPRIHRGVIASGEQVIADAVIRDEIAAAHRKIVALEMEGYGVSKAAWQSFERVRHLVIRSICDFADSSKNSEWHPYAAAVAAGYTKHFLLDRPLEPRNPSV